MSVKPPADKPVIPSNSSVTAHSETNGAILSSPASAQPHLLKGLPAPVRALVRPMLYAAIGLHALLLFTPFPTERKPQPKETEAPVKITQLPSTRSAPKPRIKVTKPLVARVNRPKTAPVVPRTEPPAQARQASTNTAQDPFADFPHHPSGASGCYGKESCYEVKGTGLTAVADYFKKALPGKKFTVSPLVEEAGKQVFQVSKADKSLFLNVFQDGKNTIYVLAPNEIKSLNDLKGAVEVPSAWYELLSDLPGANAADPAANNNIAEPQNFQKPDLFYKSLGGADKDGYEQTPEVLPIVDGSPLIAVGEEPDSLFQSFFEPQLSNIFDEVSQDGEYGGGPLYRLKKGSSTFYLSLVPLVPDSTRPVGTIVVLWTRSPR